MRVDYKSRRQELTGKPADLLPRNAEHGMEQASSTNAGSRNIALVRLSALGDVTLMLPVVRTLQRVRPDIKITWITGVGAYQLLEGVEGVEFVVIDKPRRLLDYPAFSRRLAKRRFDVVLAAQANLRANLLYPWIPATRKIGFDRTRAREGQWLFTKQRIPFAQQHLMDSFFAFLEAEGITERVLEWDLPIPDSDRDWAREQLPKGAGPLVILNPGSSKMERIWLPERYIEVVRLLQRKWDARVVLTGDRSATERGLGAYIHSQVDSSVINLVGQTTPKQLAAVIREADCLVAPDTGPVHIAVAVGTPVVGLYAVAPSWLSGPYLYSELVVDRYEQAVRQILNRDPAQVPWGTRVHTNKAMYLIEVEDVMQSLSRVFDPE